MNGILALLLVIIQVDVSGYVETRPYFAWNDSVHLFGYNRGWVELKQDNESYGAQIALDCQVWYDSTSIASFKDNINISRLALWLGKENRRITVGKQRIYWGVSRVFKPLDILNQTNYFEPGYERAGKNAILGYLSLGDLSGIKVVVQPKYIIKQSLIGGRFGTTLLKHDLGLNVFHREQSKMTIVGTELAGEAEIGYWAEMSHTWLEDEGYFKSSIGIDYSFPFYLYSMLEYFYDASGEVNPNNYDYSALLRRDRSTLAQEYLYASFGSVYNPFFRPSVNAIINLNDKGFILMPQVMYSVNDNTEMNLGVNFFFGKAESEFKNISPYQGQVYCWLKIYF
jgi:hypothetical protein